MVCNLIKSQHFKQKSACTKDSFVGRLGLYYSAWGERNQDKIEGELNLQWMPCNLALLPGLLTVHFWSLWVFVYWKQSKTTLMQIRSVLTSYRLIRPNSSIDPLCQRCCYTTIAQTQNLLSHHLVFTRTTCTPKPYWSRLQTTSQKWFAYQFANRFLYGTQFTTHFNSSSDLLSCSALARATAPVSVRSLSLRLQTWTHEVHLH